MLSFNDSEFYCATCFEDNNFTDRMQSLCVPVVNDAKFTCPEKNCDLKLSFREFFAGNCCEKSANKSNLKNGVPHNHRTEYQDLKMMMNLLELYEKEENEAGKIMVSKEKEFELARNVYDEKNTTREESRSNLASSLTNAGLFIAEDKGCLIILSFSDIFFSR